MWGVFGRWTAAVHLDKGQGAQGSAIIPGAQGSARGTGLIPDPFLAAQQPGYSNDMTFKSRLMSWQSCPPKPSATAMEWWGPCVWLPQLQSLEQTLASEMRYPSASNIQAMHLGANLQPGRHWPAAMLHQLMYHTVSVLVGSMNSIRISAGLAWRAAIHEPCSCLRTAEVNSSLLLQFL